MLTSIISPIKTPLLPHTIPEHFATIVSLYGERHAVSARAPYTKDTSITISLSSSSSASQAVFNPPAFTHITYYDLDVQSSRLSHALRDDLGVRKGTRLAVSLGNTVEYAVLTYAIFKLGAILVPLNPAFNARQVEAALKHLGVEVLIMGAVADLAFKPCKGRSNFEILKEMVPGLQRGVKHVENEKLPALRKVVVVHNSGVHGGLGRVDWAAMPALTDYYLLVRNTAGISGADLNVMPDAKLDPEDVINIQFTSGTTAHPKAAQLTHTGVLNNGYLIAKRMGLVKEDRIVVPPPLFHCFGCVLGYMATATTGAAIVFPSPAFDPRATLCAIQELEATGCYGVGTMMVALLEMLSDAQRHRARLREAGGGIPAVDMDPELTLLAKRHRPEQLRKGIVAGSLIQQALMERLMDTFGFADLVNCYGMTETSPVSVMTRPDDPMSKRTSTVGRVMDHTTIRVVDPSDRAKVVARGEAGELAVSGYLVMKGYYGDEKQTEDAFLRERGWRPEVMAGGAAVAHQQLNTLDRGMYEERVWMHTGDEAVMDEEGYVRITGRIKDLIIRGGENVHPVEVENCLFQHPAVMEASVVGVRDEHHGEAISAFVILYHGVQAVGRDDRRHLDDQDDDHNNTGDVPASLPAQRPESESATVLQVQDLKDFVREKLAKHLVPKYVFWINEFPKTASGKIQKFRLRGMAERFVHGPGDEK